MPSALMIKMKRKLIAVIGLNPNSVVLPVPIRNGIPLSIFNTRGKRIGKRIRKLRSIFRFRSINLDARVAHKSTKNRNWNLSCSRQTKKKVKTAQFK